MANFAGNGTENKGPSVAELQRLIKNRSKLEFFLVNGKSVTGILKWFDPQAFSIIQDDQSTFTLLRPGVVGYKVSSDTGPTRGMTDQKEAGPQKQVGSKKHAR